MAKDRKDDTRSREPIIVRSRLEQRAREAREAAETAKKGTKAAEVPAALTDEPIVVESHAEAAADADGSTTKARTKSRH